MNSTLQAPGAVQPQGRTHPSALPLAATGGLLLLLLCSGCRLWPKPPPTPTPPTTTTTTTTTSTTTTTVPPVGAVWSNPAIPDGPGEHLSHKTYSGVGHAGRVYAIKLPSWFYRVAGARPTNSHVLLVPAGGDAGTGRPIRRLDWYQFDDEAGHARPGYALLAASGATLADCRTGDLLALMIAGKPAAMLRLFDATLPARVQLTAGEGKAVGL